MEYCKALAKAIEEAPDDETRAELEALYASQCIPDNQGQGGGNGNGPPGGLG